MKSVLTNLTVLHISQYIHLPNLEELFKLKHKEKREQEKQ